MNARKSIHNPRATPAAPCQCPACRAKAVSVGQVRIDDYNGWAASKTRLFAIVLTGSAMAPRYQHGDLLQIDPDRAPLAGDTVLAHFDGNEERKGVMLLNGDGDLIDRRGGYVPRDCFTVEGVVTASLPASVG